MEKESLSQITSDTFDCVIDWQNMYSVTIRDISARVDLNDVTESNSQVVSDDLVHSNFLITEIIAIFDGEADTNSISSLLTF